MPTSDRAPWAQDGCTECAGRGVVVCQQDHLRPGFGAESFVAACLSCVRAALAAKAREREAAVLAEREACAKVCEEGRRIGSGMREMKRAHECAAAIRSRR